MSSNANKSPCINMCQLNSEKICVGCWRHINEIVEWRQLSEAQRKAVAALCDRRRQIVLLQEAGQSRFN